MFAWMSGSGEHLQNAVDVPVDAETILDMPETPAPIFAMRAFKQVLFGTPQSSTPTSAPLHKELPPIEDVPPINRQQQNRIQADEIVSTNGAPRSQQLLQPSEAQKQNELLREKPQGILMTPGTINGRRKQVKFGEQVVDNEGKGNKYSKSGLPDDCPGKFPSPWTPKNISPVEARAKPSPDAESKFTIASSEKRVESRFKEILHRERPSRIHPEPLIRPPRSKDDGDVTTDLTLPRSASGRYWKHQYEQYSANSVAETKRMIAKHKLAKDYARLKDDEAQELRSQLDHERRKRGKREGSLERQVKDLRERLRDALADNAKLNAEVTSIRMQLELQTTPMEVPVSIVPTVNPAITALIVKQDGKRNTPKKAAPRSSPADIWLDTDTDCEATSRRRRSRRATRTGQVATRSPVPRSALCTGSPPQEVKFDRDQFKIPRLSPLSERSINLPTSTLTPTRSRDAERYAVTTLNMKALNISKGQPQSPQITHGSIIQLDYSVPPEALSIQTSQPNTPSAVKTSKPAQGKSPSSRTPRSKTTSAENSRLEEARNRVAERRKMKRDSRTTVRV